MAKKIKRKILMVSSEIYPYAKSGGLADAVPELAKSLAVQGHDVRIIMPRYKKN
jgi:starch synthase